MSTSEYIAHVLCADCTFINFALDSLTVILRLYGYKTSTLTKVIFQFEPESRKDELVKVDLYKVRL